VQTRRLQNPNRRKRSRRVEVIERHQGAIIVETAEAAPPIILEQPSYRTIGKRSNHMSNVVRFA